MATVDQAHLGSLDPRLGLESRLEFSNSLLGGAGNGELGAVRALVVDLHHRSLLLLPPAEFSASTATPANP